MNMNQSKTIKSRVKVCCGKLSDKPIDLPQPNAFHPKSMNPTYRRTELRSLKDTLLENVVLNMGELITEDGRLRRCSPVQLVFPEGLFEEVLWKSTDMCWKIPNYCMKTFVLHRHALKWRHMWHLSNGYPLFIKEIDLLRSLKRQRSLKVTMDEIGINSVKVTRKIFEMADTLRHLDVEDSYLLPAISSVKRLKKKSALKLTELKLSGGIDHFPLGISSKTLSSLTLSYTALDKPRLGMIGECENVAFLSLSDVSLDNLSIDDVIDSALTLSRLRYLALLYFTVVTGETLGDDECAFGPDHIVRLISRSLRLEKLEISKLECRSSETRVATRKLDAFIAVNCMGRDYEALKVLARRFGNDRDLDGMLITCEETKNRLVLMTSYQSLNLMIRHEVVTVQTPEEVKRIEAVIKSTLDASLATCKPIDVFEMMTVVGLDRFSQGLLLKIISYVLTATDDYDDERLEDLVIRCIEKNRGTQMSTWLEQILEFTATYEKTNE